MFHFVPRRAVAALLSLAVAAALFSGCGDAPDSSAAGGGVPAAQVAGEDAGEFILPYSSADGFNPYLSKSNITVQNSRLLFDSFVDITNDFALDYRVARSVISSGTEVTITVGGSFADGAAITGADAAASLEAARQSPVFGARFANMGAVRYSGDTVTVTLDRPDSLFAYLLDIPVLKAGETGASSPTSSGRYSVGQDDRGPVSYTHLL